MRIALPDGFPSGVCLLVPIDRLLLPIVAGALEKFQEQRVWEPASYQAGYRAFTELAAVMTLTCAEDLIESNNRIYRLLDTALFGRVYSAGDTPPETISPSIPAIPDPSFAPPSILFAADDADQLLQSAIVGIDTATYSGTPNVLALLQAVIDGVSTGDTSLSDSLSQLELIAALLA